GIGKVDNLGDAWGLFQDLTEGFYRRVLDQNLQSVSDIPESRVFDQLSQQAQQLIGHETAGRVTLLAKRTGEMHLALASANESRPELVPEALTSEYRHEIGQAAESLFDRQITQLKDQLEMLKPEQQALAQEVIGQESIIRQRLSKLADRDLEAKIIRIHGDYHLGQVLYDESDYCIIDFEGEPLLSIPERRRKRPAYKDVAGMIRSLHYAVSGQLLLNFSYRPAQVQELKPWGNWWFRCLRTTFLHTYNNTVEQAGLLPTSAEDRELLLDLFILEKAVYEVAYELNCRLHWLDIPLQGLLFALEDAQ
ncbi:MAG: phosphotransferase, partial [Bacteroidota bacterium]